MQMVDAVRWRPVEAESIAFLVVGELVLHELHSYFAHVLNQLNVGKWIAIVADYLAFLLLISIVWT